MRFLRKDLFIVATLVAMMMLMIVPLSQQVIDALITANLTLAVVLMVVAIYLKNPSDFSTFPTVILIGTAFRLALSIGTTRLILTEADAGDIIETFGDFVIGGSVAVGLVIFLIITVVQFLVVTKGAERVAEVGARFALDALPGKQMSIDADIRAGTLNAEQGGILRKQLDRDSQFFGAMDGAMKFVKGDAIAGLIIIVINLIGGLIVGRTMMGLSMGDSALIFSLLTIGDGLVAQIPALMMSLCAGIIVTRVTSDENTDLGSDIVKELVSDVRVPAVSAGIVLLMGFIPGFPFFIFAGASLLLCVTWLVLRSVARKNAQAAEADQADAVSKAADLEHARETDRDARPLSQRFRATLGARAAGQFDLAHLQLAINTAFDRLEAARGVPFPAPSIVQGDTTGPDSLVIDLDEVPIHRETIPDDHVLIEADPETLALIGCPQDAAIPVLWIDFRGLWVPRSYKDDLLRYQIDIIPLETALARLIFRIYEQNLGLLFSKSEFDAYVATAQEADAESMAIVLEAMPATSLMQTLRYLIEDGVPLRPVRLVIDGLVQWTQANPGAGPIMISECLRGSLKRQLCHLIAGPENILGIAMVDPRIETLARKSIADAKQAGNLSSMDGLMFDADMVDPVANEFRNLLRNDAQQRQQIAVVTSADIRRRLRNFLAANNIHVPVLAAHEISSDVMTCPVQLITLPTEITVPKLAPA